jgi:drug/metabolite transporter (DMT)-like permease
MILSYFALIFGVLFTASAQLLMKKGANRSIGGGFLGAYLNWPTLLAFFLLFVTTLLNTYAYKQIQLKASVAVMPANYVVVGIFSVLFLNERLNKKQLTGGVVILVGICLYASR